MMIFETQNGLQSDIKASAVALLNERLTDSIDLALLTKQAHWNVKGPQFVALHEMLDNFRVRIDGHIDTMAERTVQLGGTALGTTQVVAKATILMPYPTDIQKIREHLIALIDRYAVVANAVRDSIHEADKFGDAGTADIFTDFSRDLDKALWFLEAHMHEPS